MQTIQGRPPQGACTVVLAIGLLAALAVAPSPATAQQRATTATLTGRVTAEDGRALAAAVVRMEHLPTGFRREVVSDEGGVYVLPLLPPGGPYTLTVGSIGYGQATRTELTLSVGERRTLDVVLGTAPVALPGLDVVAGAARVDVDRGGVVQRISAAEVERLPVRGRDFTQLLNLSPLVSFLPDEEEGGRFSIAGARTSGTTFQVDGVDAGNLFFGEPMGSSRSPFGFSLESIREVQVITNGFDVEYGNYAGGVVNAVTRGGTNEFTASGFLFHRNEVLTGAGFDGVPPDDYRSDQLGITAAGPLVRDRLHWFLAVDGQRMRTPVEPLTPRATDVDPAAYASVVGTLNRVVPGAGNRWLGRRTGRQDNLVLFGRLDWNLDARNHLVLRTNYADFLHDYDEQDFGEALTHAGTFRNRTSATVAELNSLLGGGWANSLRVQLSLEDRPRRPAEEGGYLPELRINYLETASGGGRAAYLGGDPLLYRNRLEERKVQLVDNVTVRVNDAHTVKLGTSNILSSVRHAYWVGGNGQYQFGDAEAFAAGDPLRYEWRGRSCLSDLVANGAGEAVLCRDPDTPVAEFDALEWSLYAQDEWRVSDALTLTGGVRWGGTRLDRSPEPVPAVEEAFGVSTRVSPDFSGLSPRVAFSWEGGGAAAPAVRGGVGLLVGRAPLVLAANAFATERPMRHVICDGDAIPALDLAELLAGARGGNTPVACAGGEARRGRPEFTVFSPDFQLPRTLKANLSLERALGADTRLALDLVASRTTSNYTIQDLNLRDAQFTTLFDGQRPVFVPRVYGPILYQPRTAAGPARMRDEAFDRIYNVVSEGEAEAFNVAVELRRRVSSRVEATARYGWNRTYDNSTFSCCTSYDGFGLLPTAGSPNEVGDPDAEDGAWAPSSNERRHVVILSALVEGPWGVRMDGVLRMQSGTPWSPLMAGDVNGDGVDRNDLPFLDSALWVLSEEDAATWERHLASDCLRGKVGEFAGRNSCRNPWWNALDMRLAKTVEPRSGHSVELTVDLFNVLNALSAGMGQYARVAGDDRVLLIPAVFIRSSDVPNQWEAPAGTIIYRVNPTFGRYRSVGFDPYQFQAQLGVRYRF